MNPKQLYWMAGLAIALSLSACSQEPPAGRVGVINLARVAEETGNTEKISQSLTEIRNRLQQELQAVQINLQNQLSESQARFGDTPTEEQREQLGSMIAEAQRKLQQAQADAGKELKDKQAELVTRLRDEVRPLAYDIAQQRGMTVILLQSEAVLLGNDPRTDITDAVIAELKKRASSAAPATPDAAADSAPPAAAEATPEPATPVPTEAPASGDAPKTE